MKILMITLSVFGGGSKGGGERYVSETARSLEEKGLEVTIAAVRSYRAVAVQASANAPPEEISVLTLFRIAKSMDVIHVHQLNTPGFDIATILKFVLKKPLVLTDHGGGALAFGRVLGRARLSWVDAAGFVSSWSRHDLDPRQAIAPFQILLGGGDHLPASMPLDKGFDFGYVGRLLPHKGAHIAIQALPLGATLVLAGQVRDPEYFSRLKELAQGKSVTFIEDASDQTVAGLLRSIRYLLVPSVGAYGDARYSRPELLGLVALEALALGRKVIGSKVGGLEELLDLAAQRTVPAGDVVAWSKALTEAFRETESALDVRQRFTWGEVADKCIGLYQQVCGAARVH